VDEVCLYNTEDTGSQRRRRGLPYALRQLVAREIDLVHMRKEDEKSPLTSSSTNTPNLTSNKSQERGESQQKKMKQSPKKGVEGVASVAKVVDRADRDPVDFFGRPLDPKVLLAKEAEDKADSGGGIISSDIWFKFKEGYNNAVRRTVKMKDLA